METIFWVLAIIGSAFFLLKIAALMLGFDTDVDVDMDGDFDISHGMMGDIQILSLFSICAFMMMGGWVGLAAINSWGMGNTMAIIVGAASGFAFMFLSAWGLARVKRLEDDGTLRNFDPKGTRGEVYVRVPKAGDGEGQVKIEVKGRVKIFRAVTDEDEAIDSFRPVEVRNMTSDKVLLVRRTG